MTNITPTTYTSEDSFDVIVPNSLTGGTYSIEVSGTSAIGSAEFTVLGGPVILPYGAVPSSKIGITSVTQSYVITAAGNILTGAVVLSAGSPASISTISQIDTQTVTLSLLVTANGDIGLSATDVLGQTTTNIITDYVIYETSPTVNGQGPGIKFTNHNTYDRFFLTNEEPGSVHVTITDNYEMIYDAITPTDWIVLVDGSVGEIDQTSWVQTTSAIVDFDIINISATGNVTISAMNYRDSFTNSETDGRWNVGCSDNNRLINLVDFLPQHLYDSETFDFTKLFENFLNTMYEDRDHPCNYGILKKIEQIGDLHDPQLMDTEYLQFYANFLGYDLTLNRGEIGNITNETATDGKYIDDEESKKYLRFVVENLPNWYKIKSTRNAVKIMLFSFGIIGDLFTQFSNDYDKNWIRDREDDESSIGTQIPSEYYPTPHFQLAINLRETSPPWLQNLGVILNAVDSIRPINTVFERFGGYYDLDPVNINVFAGSPHITQSVYIDWSNSPATCASNYTNMYSNSVDGNLDY